MAFFICGLYSRAFFRISMISSASWSLILCPPTCSSFPSSMLAHLLILIIINQTCNALLPLKQRPLTGDLFRRSLKSVRPCGEQKYEQTLTIQRAEILEGEGDYINLLWIKAHTGSEILSRRLPEI